MVMRDKTKTGSTRSILAYFVESKLWKDYMVVKVDNYAYWVNEDPDRARRMFAARAVDKKGYKVNEVLYDMLDCVYGSSLKKSTKSRLFNEIDEAEKWHEFMGTVEVEL